MENGDKASKECGICFHAIHDLLNNRICTLKHSSFATQYAYVLRHNQGTLSLLDSIMCRVRTTVLLYDKLQHVQRSSGVLLLRV